LESADSCWPSWDSEFQFLTEGSACGLSKVKKDTWI
jgi:hypothetical protein